MARRSTFSGGIFPDSHQSGKNSPLTHMPPPGRLLLPISGEPLLQAGDRVLRGQMVGSDPSGLPLHSAVSGQILSIDEIGGQPHYVILNDGENSLDPGCVPFTKPLAKATTEEIVDILRAGGITDAPENGAPLPQRITQAKEQVTTLIINGCEGQPYMTALSRLLLDQPQRVINGTKILLKALGVRQAVIAIDEDKLEAINQIEGLIAASKLISVRVMRAKYPQEEPRQLIYALTEKEHPVGRPLEESGCMVVRADTCAAVFDAFAEGLPQLECLITAGGNRLKTRRNLYVPLGTPVEDVLAFCGGLKGKACRIVLGGSLTGKTTEDIDVPVTRQTIGVLALAHKTPRYSACIRCGQCCTVCPMHLMPAYLAQAAQKENWSICQQYSVKSCIECGSCAYVCPGRVPLVEAIRSAKAALTEEAAASDALSEKPPLSPEEPLKVDFEEERQEEERESE